MPSLSTSIRSAVLVGFSSFSVGCMPAVMHGPQVDPGLVGGISLSSPSIDKQNFGGERGERFNSATVGVHLGYGWRSTRPAGSAVQVGVHVPGIVGVTFTQGDLYYQLPARVTGQLDAGVGLNVAITHTMPYVQFGKISADGSGWYTTQGITLVWEQTQYWSDRWADNVSSVVWIPTIAYQTGRPTRTVQLFLTGGLGKQYGDCFDGRCDPDQLRWALSTGVALQFHRKR